jgi:hypothetical protein
MFIASERNYRRLRRQIKIYLTVFCINHRRERSAHLYYRHWQHLRCSCYYGLWPRSSGCASLSSARRSSWVNIKKNRAGVAPRIPGAWSGRRSSPRPTRRQVVPTGVARAEVCADTPSRRSRCATNARRNADKQTNAGCLLRARSQRGRRRSARANPPQDWGAATGRPASSAARG